MHAAGMHCWFEMASDKRGAKTMQPRKLGWGGSWNRFSHPPIVVPLGHAVSSLQLRRYPETEVAPKKIRAAMKVFIIVPDDILGSYQVLLDCYAQASAWLICSGVSQGASLCLTPTLAWHDTYDAKRQQNVDMQCKDAYFGLGHFAWPSNINMSPVRSCQWTRRASLSWLPCWKNSISFAFSRISKSILPICAIRDTLIFLLGLSLNSLKNFLGLVSYFVSYFSANIGTLSLIFFQIFQSVTAYFKSERNSSSIFHSLPLLLQHCF